MPPAPRPAAVPLGDRPRRRFARSRRVSALVVVATVLAVGGAVAAVYTTGVTLGTRIAPSNEPDARPRPPGSGDPQDTDGGGGGSTSSTGAEPDPDGALPDRVEGSGTSTTVPGSTEGPPGPGATDGTDPDTSRPGPVEPYPGMWPYASWEEVAAHVARGDGRYRTPDDTARRFAAEVVGLTGAVVRTVDEGEVVATVEIRTGSGATLVTLTHATPGLATAATPWSVVAATGDVDLTVPTVVRGATVPVTTTGAPGVIGVHDRTEWRSVGVAPAPGRPFDLRLDPGPAGPGIVVAFAGDPRRPSSFTVRRLNLAAGSGAPAAPAPADPVAATRALVDATGRGDVGATWELLDGAARRTVLDWRGLAGRLPALRDELGRFASGDLTTTTITTSVGPVAVVAPAVGATDGTTDGTLAALAFRIDDGARLASIDSGSVAWTGPSGEDATVVASGPVRPLVLVVDGGVWASTPDGTGGLRASSAGLAPGPHLAIAITDQGGQVTASAFLFNVDRPASLDPPEPEPVPAAETP